MMIITCVTRHARRYKLQLSGPTVHSYGCGCIRKKFSVCIRTKNILLLVLIGLYFLLKKYIENAEIQVSLFLNEVKPLFNSEQITIRE